MDHLPQLPEGWPFTQGPDGPTARRFNREPTCRPPKRVNWIGQRAKFEEMWRENVDVEEMADFFAVSPGTIYSKASQWHLGRRRSLRGPRKSKNGASRRIRPDPTGQRRKIRLAEAKGPKIVLEPHDPRFRAGTTVFPTSVVPASGLARLLKRGDNSYKIGRLVTKGPWSGFPLYTLTLEERATCPRTCREWASCYGNNMPFAQRIFDDGTLTRRLWGELAAIQAEHGRFVVRLHVLGDFYSVEYVDAWRRYLSDFPKLHVFGFTARRPPDPIGNSLVKLAADELERFKMRFSGAGYETDCSEVVDSPESPMIGIRCPAETDPVRSCATCGLCWTSNRTISFVRH